MLRLRKNTKIQKMAYKIEDESTMLAMLTTDIPSNDITPLINTIENTIDSETPLLKP